MTGHGRKTVADTYGEFPPELAEKKIARLVNYVTVGAPPPS
jgi:hypothetical protein